MLKIFQHATSRQQVISIFCYTLKYIDIASNGLFTCVSKIRLHVLQLCSKKQIKYHVAGYQTGIIFPNWNKKHDLYRNNWLPSQMQKIE